MKLIALELPEEAAEQAVWLEEQIVGPDLRLLAAELVALAGQPQPPNRTAAEVLGDAVLPSVLKRGLRQLDRQQIRQLIKHPSALLDLQRLIDESDSEYWNEVLARVWSAVPSDEPPANSRPALQLAGHTSTNWQLPAAWSSYALAASLLFAAWGTFMFIRGDAPSNEIAAAGWGWNNDKSLAEQSPAEYLRNLASGAQQWFDKRPTSAAAVGQRLNELRTGCSRLILADHKPLSAADRAQLLDHCREWAKQFDTQLAALESGADPLRVRDQVDAVMREATRTLQLQADTIGRT